jgi:WD40 repeat protein
MFSVTGMSSNNWDDCLARLTMGEDQTTSKVFCKDTFFVTLVGIDSTLIVWDSDTCEEIRRFTHMEYVTHMTSSKTSNLVATAGFKTTRIWDITTGEELFRLPKERRHHTRALAFGANDDEILIAYDDCSVQCFDLVTAQENWRFLAKEPGSQDHNCARYMAFSPDLTQIAIVFRGRPVVVWTIQHSSFTYIPPKRCVLTEDDMRSAVEGDAWNAPEVALWQPGTDHLLILYEDTKIVDWNVADDEQMQYDHMGARGMVLSPDGNLLLTSDVNGTLSIWMVPEYRLTYQLKYEELVTDLAFSPDGTRFYDIRGTFCNVWEPDALIRPSDLDHEDMSSNYESITSVPVISQDNNTRVPITALVCDSSDKFYCCGKEDGTVVMYNIPEGKKVRKIISHSSSVSVIKLAWSASEKYLASADDSGRIIAKRLESPASVRDKWAVYPLFEIRVDEAFEQFLFSSREDFLLIAGRTTACVMNLRTKEELCHTRHPRSMDGVWINHPTDPTVLVRIEAGQERQYLWKTLEPKDEPICPSPEVVDLADSSYTVRRTMHVRGHWLVLEIVATSRNYVGSQNRHIEVLDLHKLQSSRPIETSRRQRIDGLAKHVRRLIGCFQDRIVFMDHQFWLCTWAVEPVYSKHKRHFFLSKDWLSPTALTLIALNKLGTLLCPRNGEVAIVRSGLKH